MEISGQEGNGKGRVQEKWKGERKERGEERKGLLGEEDLKKFNIRNLIQD